MFANPPQRKEKIELSTGWLATGNEHAAHALLRAGVRVVASWPGGPVTEIVDEFNRIGGPFCHAEWSANEKVAMEVAAGAAMSGVPSATVMKMFGVNVAADFLYSLPLMGVSPMVLIFGDDPGGLKSHSEQDSRWYALSASIPVLEPSTPEEVGEMVEYAVELSAKQSMPVIVRLLNWVAYSSAPLVKSSLAPVAPARTHRVPGGYHTRPVVEHHDKLLRKLEKTRAAFEESQWNGADEQNGGSSPLGIVATGQFAGLIKETIGHLGLGEQVSVFKLGTPHPLPEKLLGHFLDRKSAVLVIEETDPIVEDACATLCHRLNLDTPILGRRSGALPRTGELGRFDFGALLAKLVKAKGAANPVSIPETLIPDRPGATASSQEAISFYSSIQSAFEDAGRQFVMMGDIGDHSKAPRKVMHAHAALGSSIGMAIGTAIVESEAVSIAAMGDGSLFAGCLPGIASAVYNGQDLLITVFDDGATSATGGQAAMTSGFNLRGPAPVLSLEAALSGLGVPHVVVCDAADSVAIRRAVVEMIPMGGVRAIVGRTSCSGSAE